MTLKSLIMKALCISHFFILLVSFLGACKKIDYDAINTDTILHSKSAAFREGTATLKSSSRFPIGAGINHVKMQNDTAYARITSSEFDNITCEYEMKHGFVIQRDGTFNFTAADQLVNQAITSGQFVHGHALVWNQVNNSDYLKRIVIANQDEPMPNVLSNSSFENVSDNGFADWSNFADGGSSALYETETKSPQQGKRSLKVTVKKTGSHSWSVQTINNINWVASKGALYQIKLYAKSNGSGSFRLINHNRSFAQFDITPTTEWKEYTWYYMATESAPQFKIFYPEAGTFWIDNIRVVKASRTTSALNNSLKKWISTIVARYKDKVKSWDVINEPLNENGELRINYAPAPDSFFYWEQFLGKNYIANALTYAHDADPSAELLINECELEKNVSKLDSLVKLIKELKAQRIPIHGIGTQMHINYNTDRNGIDKAFQKLASTGLKIKVTELDVRMNPDNSIQFVLSKPWLDHQALTYQYVVESYYKYVPVSQRLGITVWNIADTDSWLFLKGEKDYPTLFDSFYQKKPAYQGFIKGLQSAN